MRFDSNPTSHRFVFGELFLSNGKDQWEGVAERGELLMSIQVLEADRKPSWLPAAKESGRKPTEAA